MTSLRRNRTRTFAFSLIEIMIAVLFISIGFFGYVALHSRILHSGQKLEEQEVVRASTDFYEGLEVARLITGHSQSIDGTSFVKASDLEDYWVISTAGKGVKLDWFNAYPVEFQKGLENTMELSPGLLAEPYSYSWKKR